MYKQVEQFSQNFKNNTLFTKINLQNVSKF